MHVLLIVVAIMVIWGVSIGVAFSLESMMVKDHKIEIDDENTILFLVLHLSVPSPLLSVGSL
jgi:hypothetical protein